jgi:hypothetical protein
MVRRRFKQDNNFSIDRQFGLIAIDYKLSGFVENPARNSGLGIRRSLAAVARLFRGGVLITAIGESPRL